ncbi:MAG: glycosyltransferase [Flavobacteriales bacterium]|nr:glycosyltransferase [Flavobacteriales bacterium]
MRVCQLTTVHGPFDDRIFFKQCVSLAAAGHEVIELAPAEHATTEQGVRIQPLNIPVQRVLRMLVGGWRAYRATKALRPDVVHFHDPELLPVGFLLKWRGIRVVYDMHELVQRQILDKTWLGPGSLRKTMAAVYGRIERAAVSRFDAIVLAESRYTDELFPRYPRHLDKFTLVRNFPVLSVIDRHHATVAKGEGLTVIYVGGLSEARGIGALINAVDRVPGARLWLLGSWASPEFQASCEARSGFARTTWFGQLRMDEVYAYIRAADLGACVLHPLPNYVVSEPIKTYEYLACGIPLLLSDFPLWRDRFGPWSWFVDPLDENSIVAAIRIAQEDASGRTEKARSGRIVVEEERCWERESARLIDLYRKLEAR